MKQEKNHIAYKKQKRSNFNPKREEIRSAIDEYLKSGGKIKRIELDENSYNLFMGNTEHAANDFLTEGC